MNTAVTEILSQCYPFNQFDAMDLAQYWPRMEHRRCKRGQALLRNNMRSSVQLTYLISGVAELRRSFFDRQSLQPGTESTLQPLDNLLTDEGGQIVAVDECEAIVVPRALLDEVLETSARRERAASAMMFGKSLASNGAESGKSVFMPGDVLDVNYYGVLSDTDLSDEFRVSDGDVEVDWMSRFLQLPLANHLPPAGIQQLLACLQSVDVAKGDVIIKRGEPGDAMYVLTRGVASVRVDPDNAANAREFPLIPGDYFGEESLVADTIRNASVAMESDGAVAKLDRETFMELIYPHLVRTANAKLVQAAEKGDGSVQLLDVRFPVEFRRKSLRGSRNIPISELRASIGTLALDKPCVVAHCGGSRSELAVFLLRQAGFDAYLLTA